MSFQKRTSPQPFDASGYTSRLILYRNSQRLLQLDLFTYYSQVFYPGIAQFWDLMLPLAVPASLNSSTVVLSCAVYMSKN